ncbi:MAG: hypothetical protein AAF702_09050 [Chloroflexota bacterium]
MLQKSAASSSIFGLSNGDTPSSPGTNPLDNFVWQNLHPDAWLPNSIHTFIRLFIVIIVIGAGLLVNIYISSQILAAKVTQQELEAQYQEIQRTNSQIVWEISHHSSIEQVQQRSDFLGFIAKPDRSYAVATVTEEKLASLLETKESHGGLATEPADPSNESQLTLSTQQQSIKFPPITTVSMMTSDQLQNSQNRVQKQTNNSTSPNPQVVVMAQVNLDGNLEERASTYFFPAIQSVVDRLMGTIDIRTNYNGPINSQ